MSETAGEVTSSLSCSVGKASRPLAPLAPRRERWAVVGGAGKAVTGLTLLLEGGISRVDGADGGGGGERMKRTVVFASVLTSVSASGT